MKIYCDYDNVLNNMSQKWLEWINDSYTTNYTPQDITSWDFYHTIKTDKIRPFDWFQGGQPFKYGTYGVTPYRGAIDFFKSLNSLGDTYILTASMGTTNRGAKEAHIYKYFTTEAVIHETAKQKYAVCSKTADPNILIDDRLSTCLLFAAKGGHAILYNHNNTYEYNRIFRQMEGVTPVSNYDEVLEAIRRIKYGS